LFKLRRIGHYYGVPGDSANSNFDRIRVLYKTKGIPEVKIEEITYRIKPNHFSNLETKCNHYDGEA